MSNFHYSINMAARKSGLTPHVIRVWERRYRAVQPARTGTNRRLYTDVEVGRLSLLREAVAAGHRIGNVAGLTEDELRQLLVTAPPAGEGEMGRRTRWGEGGELDFEGQCVEVIRRMDAQALEDLLTRALILHGHQGLLRKVVAPLARRIGDLWNEGSMTAAQEHFASAFLRTFLGNAARPFAANDGTPCLVVATPSGQLHELGAVIVGAAARHQGWRVVYLGVSLPAAEIAGAAVQNQARAVALSVVYPADDALLEREFRDLRRFLPGEIRILAGGRASEAYREVLDEVGALRTECLDAFCQELDRLRARRPVAPAGAV